MHVEAGVHDVAACSPTALPNSSSRRGLPMMRDCARWAFSQALPKSRSVRAHGSGHMWMEV